MIGWKFRPQNPREFSIVLPIWRSPAGPPRKPVLAATSSKLPYSPSTTRSRPSCGGGRGIRTLGPTSGGLA